jgi:hypothetical protein
MYIFKISNKGGKGFSKSVKANIIRPSNKQFMQDEGKIEKIFEDNSIRTKTDNLKNLNISKPRIPKKYIQFE